MLRLEDCLRTTLFDLAGALAGSIIMSLEIESSLQSVRLGEIPVAWLLQGYPSKRGLASYIDNLAKRVQFYNSWIEVLHCSVPYHQTCNLSKKYMDRI